MPQSVIVSFLWLCIYGRIHDLLLQSTKSIGIWHWKSTVTNGLNWIHGIALHCIALTDKSQIIQFTCVHLFIYLLILSIHCSLSRIPQIFSKLLMKAYLSESDQSVLPDIIMCLVAAVVYQYQYWYTIYIYCVYMVNHSPLTIVYMHIHS